MYPNPRGPAPGETGRRGYPDCKCLPLPSRPSPVSPGLSSHQKDKESLFPSVSTTRRIEEIGVVSVRFHLLTSETFGRLYPEMLKDLLSSISEEVSHLHSSFTLSDTG